MKNENNNIQDLENFANRMQAAVTACIGYCADVSLDQITKNNDEKRTALIIRKKGTDIGVVIYLEPCYMDHQKGIPMGRLVQKVIDTYSANSCKEPVGLDFIKDYSRVKKMLSFRLVNRERNKEILKDSPYEAFLDLALIPCCVIFLENGSTGQIRIKNSYLTQWGIHPSQVLKDARENARRFVKIEFVSISQFISSLGDDPDECDDEEMTLAEEEQHLKAEMLADVMYSLTNTDHFYGSAVLAIPEYLKLVGDKLGNSYYILPSSVHDLVIVNDPEADPKALKKVVREVNMGPTVDCEEILSYNVYFYDRETGNIQIK